MPRVTLGDACNPVTSRIPAAVGSAGGVTDNRLVAWINEATQRLLFEGRWWGTYQSFKICAAGGFITLPPQIATIERAAVCGRPIPVHDLWFEYQDNGAGLRQFYQNTCGGSTAAGCSPGGCGFAEANYKGQYPVFSDIIPQGKKLQFICDVESDVFQNVIAFGYDDNNNWIRTQQNGAWVDGEVISLAQGTGTKSVNNYSVITDVQLPGLSGQVWLYEYNIAATTSRLLANYQYWENRPSYARYFFPSVQALVNGQGCSNNTPAGVGVDCIGKLAYIPAIAATDYLIIGNIPALKEMVMALKRAENEEDNVKSNQIIAAGLLTAKHLLDQELDHQLGAGRRIGINLQGSGNPDGLPVETLI